MRIPALARDHRKMPHRAWTSLLAIAFLTCLLGTRGRDAAAGALAAPAAAQCIPASRCCKICDKGYACGDSCISRSKQCHKGRGCACNSTEVCTDSS